LTGRYKYKTVINKCCIIGLGLLGGSLGLAIGENKFAKERWGMDCCRMTEEKALRMGAIDHSGSLGEALDGADLVILAIPVGKIPFTLQTIVPFLGAETIVTDTGSTKRNVLEAMFTIKGSCKPVGGHPMVGSEKSGIISARANLFLQSTYYLVPVGEERNREVKIMKKFITALGANPVVIDAKVHDRVMAPLSHLPQLVALGLVSVLQQYSLEIEDIEKYMGKGFLDTTRIAAGNSSLWHDIFNNNKDNLFEAVSFLLKEIDNIQKILSESDRQALIKIIEDKAVFRRSIS